MIRIQTVFPLAILACLLWMAGASCSCSANNHPRTSEQQASDHAVLSVTYETVMQQVEEIAKKDKDLMRLDIGEKTSQFRSVIIEWVLDNGLVYGSPTSLNHPFKGYVWLHYQVVKNLPKAGYLYFTHDAISTRDKIEGLFEWELLDGDTIICDYPCKKARTIFRGRTWTVWYSPLLPYSDGPWKFCGLPGVVLDASEAEGKLAFHCKGIEKDTGHGIFLIKENASPMLRKDSHMLYGQRKVTREGVSQESPIVINSGFRSPEVNQLCGGAKNSNHLTGCAVDIHCAGKEQAIRYACILLDIADGKKLDFDELILEKRGTTIWVHFAVRPKGNRRYVDF